MPGYDLKAALKRVSTKPSRFVVIKGTVSEQVYVSAQPASPKLLAPILEECGKGKRVGEGICMLENDQLVFATKSAPSPALGSMVAKVLKNAQCGQFLPLGWRQIGEKDEAEGSTEEEAEEVGATKPEAMGTTPDAKGAKPEAKAPTKDAPADDRMALLKKRLEAILPKFKAIAAKPAAQDIKLKISEAGVFGRKKDYDQANRLLDEVDALLKTIAPPEPSSESPKGETSDADGQPGAGPLRDKCQSRITALEPLILAAQKSRADEAQWMTVFMAAQDYLKAGRLADVAKILDRLEKRLSTPPDASTQKPRVASGTVDYAKLQLRWRAAQSDAAGAMAEFGKKLLAIPEVQADPRFARVQKLVAGLPHLIPSFGSTLADQLDAAAKDGPDAAESRLAARGTIAVYLQQLAAVPVLAGLESFAQRILGAELPSTTALSAALNELDATLAKAA